MHTCNHTHLHTRPHPSTYRPHPPTYLTPPTHWHTTHQTHKYTCRHPHNLMHTYTHMHAHTYTILPCMCKSICNATVTCRSDGCIVKNALQDAGSWVPGLLSNSFDLFNNHETQAPHGVPKLPKMFPSSPWCFQASGHFKPCMRAW